MSELSYSVSLRVMVLAIGLSFASRALAQDDVTFVAQQRYDEGLRAYEANEPEAALAHFRASLAMARSPNTRLMVAHCLRNLGRAAEAFMEYELTQREAADRVEREPRFEATLEAAEREIETLAPRVGRIRVRMNERPPGLEISIGDRRLPAEAIDVAVPVDVGTAVVRASAPGYESAEREIEISAGVTADLGLRLAPVSERLDVAPETAPPSSSVSPALALGVVSSVLAVLAAGAGSGLFIAAQLRYDELAEQCGASPCTADRVPSIDEGRAFELGGGSSFAVAGAAAIAAIVALAIWAAEGSPAGRAAQPWRVHF
jgi:hypothetical protein